MLRGLRNTGNSCYRNAALQVLSAIEDLDVLAPPEWRAFKNRKGAEIPRECIDRWNELAKDKAAHFLSFGHHDAVEYMYFLVDNFFHEYARVKFAPVDVPKDEELDAANVVYRYECDIIRRREYSPLYPLMYGVEAAKHMSPHRAWLEPRLFHLILLSKDHPSVSAALRAAREVSEIDGWKDDTLPGHPIVPLKKQTVFCNLPKYLCLQFMDAFGRAAPSTSVTLDAVLKRAEFGDVVRDRWKEFRLFAMIVYISSKPPVAGHYIAIIHGTAGWNIFDDDSVRTISEEEFDITSAVCYPCALFYKGVS